MSIIIKETKNIHKDQVIALYTANKWSSAKKPTELLNALQNSHSVITAWKNDTLVGLGSALSDGHLVVYYPHLLVHPNYHGQGIGKLIIQRFSEIYGNFHQQILVAENTAVEFYKKCGFTQASDTTSMWIYKGDDH